MKKEDKMEKLESDYLYLAHPRLSMGWVRKWQLNLEMNGGVNFLNPFYDIKSGEEREEDITEKNPLNAYANLNGSTSHEEKKCIRTKRCKGIVAIIDGSKSYGTPMEILYTFEVCKKPVYTLITDGYEEHPWIKGHSTTVFIDRNVMENRLIELYGNKRSDIIHG